jgi:hypothetical protein
LEGVRARDVDGSASTWGTLSIAAGAAFVTAGTAAAAAKEIAKKVHNASLGSADGSCRYVGPTLRKIGSALRDFRTQWSHRVGQMTQDEQPDMAESAAMNIVRNRLVTFEAKLRQLERIGRDSGRRPR